MVVSPDGVVRHRIDLADLFDAIEISGFPHTPGGVSWLGGGWIDERRHEVVVIARALDGRPAPRILRVVNVDSGKIARGTSHVIVRALAEMNVKALDLALELVENSRILEAKQYLGPLLDNESLPIETRLKSAVALAAFGDYRGRGSHEEGRFNQR